MAIAIDLDFSSILNSSPILSSSPSDGLVEVPVLCSGPGPSPGGRSKLLSPLFKSEIKFAALENEAGGRQSKCKFQINLDVEFGNKRLD